MKKTLSAVLAMIMILSCFAFTGTSAFAESTYSTSNLDENNIEDYVYVDPDGGAVAYYKIGGSYSGTDPAGSTSIAPFGSLTAAVQALDKVGGGTLVLLSDIGLYNLKSETNAVRGDSDTTTPLNVGPADLMYFKFPKHENMIKLRGTPEFRATIWCWSQSEINGPTWFEQYIHFDSQDGGGDDGIMFKGNKGVFGRPDGAYDDVTFNQIKGGLNIIGGQDGDKLNRGIDLTFYSGQSPRDLRFIGAGGGTDVVTGDAVINIYAVDMTGAAFKFNHGNRNAKNCINQNVIINIYGGAKFKSGQVINERGADTSIKGDLIVNVYGKEKAGSLGTINTNVAVGGKKILNMIDAPDAAVDTSSYDIVVKETSEKEGGDAAITEGLDAVTAGTTDKVSFGGIIEAVGKGLSISEDYTEKTHNAPVVYTGTKLVIADGATFTLGGDVTFKDIEIVLGDDAVIDAGDNIATFESTVVIKGTGKINGSKVEIEAGKNDITITAADIDAFGGNNTTLIELENTDVVLFNTLKTTTIRRHIADGITSGSVVYYITNIEGATSVDGEMTIVDEGGKKVILKDLVVNKWGTATFDASEMQNADFIKFTPATLPDGYYLYIHSINFSKKPLGYNLDYGTVETDRNGQVIYPIADVTIPGIDWVERSRTSGIKAEEKFFGLGVTTMLTYKDSDVTAPYAEYRFEEDFSLDTEWQPYVKIEYYIHANPDDEIREVKPVLEIDGEKIEADQVITTNESAIATFEIADIKKSYTKFRFYPYGTNATDFNEQNKVYLGDTIISCQKDETVPEYKIPELDENGLVIGYKYVPDDGKPVVYVSQSMGSYKGDYKGSIDSTVAYKSINEAIKALKGVGGYIILLDDLTAHHGEGNKGNLNFEEHSEMITIRGKVDEENPSKKMELDVKYMTALNGPMTFEHLKINNLSGDDKIFMTGANLLVLGKEGVENDVVMNGFSTLSGTNIVINSANVPAIRFNNWHSTAQTISSNVNIVINGGSVGNIKGAHVGGGSTTINGDVNITINGGIIAGKINPLSTDGSNPTKINGNFNVTVTGGTFTCPDGSIYTASVPGVHEFNGDKRTLDILEYTGDSEALLKKFNLSEFDVLKINTVYVSSEKGNDENIGFTKDDPVKTLAQALANMAKKPEGATDKQVYSGRIKIIDYVIDGTEIVDTSVAATEALIMGDTANSVITVEEGFLKLACDTRFKNVTFDVKAEEAGIDANSFKLVMEKDVTVKSDAGLTIIGGTKGADITINGGKYDSVYGAIEDATGDSNITINGGEFGEVVTAKENLDGNASITINGGRFNGEILGGSVNGNIGGKVKLNVNGGEFERGSEIIGGNSDDGAIKGSVIITITDGNFNSMDEQAIKAGKSSNENTEFKLVLDEYSGNITGIYDSIGFDLIIKSRPEGPAVGGRFVYILQEIITGKNGLDNVDAPNNDGTSSTPSKPAKLVYNPVTIEGRRLTRTVGSSDAFVGTKDNKDGKSVAKIVPNNSSNRQLSIEGHGTIPSTDTTPQSTIDHSMYRYVVLKYFYETKNDTVIDVPAINILRGGYAEGEKPAELTEGGIYESITPKDKIKVNQWTYAVMDIKPADQTKYLTRQYHLMPFGNHVGGEVPEGDVIYIESLTFYAKMPVLDEQGNVIENAPAVGGDTVLEEEEFTDADIEAKDPTVVAPTSLRYGMGTSDAFASKVTTFEGKQVVAITPNTSSSDDVAIDGTSAVTAENGVISMKNYKYAVIKYYFKTAKGTATKNPSIEMLSIGLRDEAGAIGQKTFEATEALKANEWATATIRLSGKPSAHLSKGFILNPFGAMKGSAFAAGDTLYIESVTFCTEVE